MSVKLTTLGKYAKVQGGFAYKSKDFSTSDRFPVLKIKNIRFGSIDYTEAASINEDLAKATIDWQTKEGDILISMTGSGPNAPQSLVGRVARVWRNEPTAWINQRVGRLILKDQNSIHPDFLFYILSTPKSQDYLVSNSSGSANQANISGKIIESLPCPDISYEKSASIAKVLRDIDEKILINQKTNQTLEAIAQALFKSWFVDFDPVKAKLSVLAAGGSAEAAERAAMCAISARDEASLNTLQTEQPEAYAELAQTAALFPSAMQDSELGEIPEGWELSEIGKEVTILGGGTPSTKQPEFWDNGDICWTTPKDLSNATDQVILDTERKITKDGLNKISSGLLPANTVLLSSRAPVGYLALTKVPLAINQGYIAMRCEQNLPPEYVLLWASSVMDEIKQRASGTTFAEISKKNFRPIKVIVPPRILLKIFNNRASNIYDQIANNVYENSTLKSTRDSLLPRLLNGELKVSGGRS
ncbi:restriction endonuclease subunit S [Endozoicomonas acroporae]|uniref:restriction endonuclease subunit S n=1 Tax=Endozoicomonas acroporae TaxID=1701104 RepID=UPI003D7A256D